VPVTRVTLLGGLRDPHPAPARITVVRSALAAAAAILLVSGCGKGSNTIHGYGMSLTLPAGWHGRISHGYVAARGDHATLELSEWQPSPEERSVSWFLRRKPPLHVNARDFTATESSLAFALNGRYFAVFVHASKRPKAAVISRADKALASFHARRGNFYGGNLLPASFPSGAGWHVGTSKPGTLRAQGGQTESWAATTPYRDASNQLPPWRTLARLRPDGVLLWLGLSRSNKPVGGGGWNSFRIDARKAFVNFEGNASSRISLYRAYRHGAGFDEDLWVFFGRPHPRPSVVARAQAELDSVKLPSWPRG